MEINKIYIGDNIESLRQLEDNSVNCCITSPPYYGLRDYGTAKWVGGDPNCPHREVNPFGASTNVGTHSKMKSVGEVAGNAHVYKKVCKRCGAIREDLQVGLEETPEQYIERLVNIFREVKRILRDDGTLWVNIGDTYNVSSYRKDEKSSGQGKQGTNKGSYENVVERATDRNSKPKDMIGIPWMLAFALRNDGWYLRQDIIWHKPNPMPEPVKDRCVKSHEYIFLLSKKPHYYFDYEQIQEPANIQQVSAQIRFGGNKYGDDGSSQFDYYSGAEYTPKVKSDNQDQQYAVRNKRDVWSVCPSTYKGSHFATFPEELIEPMILAGCPEDGVVLDPFMGSGTVGVVSKKNNRNWIGCELNPEYAQMAEKRINNTLTSLF